MLSFTRIFVDYSCVNVWNTDTEFIVKSIQSTFTLAWRNRLYSARLYCGCQFMFPVVLLSNIFNNQLECSPVFTWQLVCKEVRRYQYLKNNHLISNSTIRLGNLWRCNKNWQHCSFDKYQLRKVTHEILSIKWHTCACNVSYPFGHPFWGHVKPLSQTSYFTMIYV